MLKERSIPEEWVMRTVNDPDSKEIMADSMTHYIRPVLKIEAEITQIRRWLYFHSWVVNDSSWHLLHKSLNPG
jgi:hypothetical protein